MCELWWNEQKRQYVHDTLWLAVMMGSCVHKGNWVGITWYFCLQSVEWQERRIQMSVKGGEQWTDAVPAPWQGNISGEVCNAFGALVARMCLLVEFVTSVVLTQLKKNGFLKINCKKTDLWLCEGLSVGSMESKCFYYLWLSFVSLYFSEDCSPGQSVPGFDHSALGLCPHCRRAQAQQNWSSGMG